MWKNIFINFPGVARDALGAHNEYTIGKALRQNLGSVNVLIPTLTKALGAHHTSALISTFALPAGVAMLGMIVLQGRDASEKLGKIHNTLDAQTALASAGMFAEFVSNYLQQRIEETRNNARGASHWFFVYHPDTNWHPNFDLLWGRTGKRKRLIGISDNLPQLCCFMMHIRTYLKNVGNKQLIAFHLLMPAYRYMYIEEKLAFNPGLYPLILEGHVYDSHPFVTLRVVNEEKKKAFKMRGIENQPDEEPQLSNLWNLFASETLVLDLGNNDTESDSDESNAYYDTDSSEHGSSGSRSTSARLPISSSQYRSNQGKAFREPRTYTSASSERAAWIRRRRPPFDTKGKIYHRW